MPEKFVRFKVRLYTNFTSVRYHEAKGYPDNILFVMITNNRRLHHICETLMLHLIGKYAV